MPVVRGHSPPGQAADIGRQAVGPAARSHRRLQRSCRAISRYVARSGVRSTIRQTVHMVRSKDPRRRRSLPSNAGVHGTTGYEWMNAITQALVDGGMASSRSTRSGGRSATSRRNWSRCWRGQTPGAGNPPDQRIHRADAPVGANRLRPLLDARLFRGQSAAGARTYVLHFPVYRTYLTSSAPTERDRSLISGTIEKARKMNGSPPTTASSIFSAIP